MEGMTFIVKTVTGLLIAVIFSFGIYITIYGHLTPGGGFAGGIMLACGLILVTLAFGKNLAGDVEFTLTKVKKEFKEAGKLAKKLKRR